MRYRGSTCLQSPFFSPLFLVRHGIPASAVVRAIHSSGHLAYCVRHVLARLCVCPVYRLHHAGQCRTPAPVGCIFHGHELGSGSSCVPVPSIRGHFCNGADDGAFLSAALAHSAEIPGRNNAIGGVTYASLRIKFARMCNSVRTPASVVQPCMC